jgi:branched-chain amino acid aminotransferase
VPATTVIAELRPLPLRERAPLYAGGARLRTSAHRRVPSACVPTRAKTHSYVAQHLAALEAADHGCLPLMLAVDGRLAEGSTYNVFVARGGALLTPTTDVCLPGVSRAAVIRLAAAAGIEVRERDLTLDDALGADEVFVTSTSLCLCPVAFIDGVRVGGPAAPVWGPMASVLRDAYSEDVGLDFVAQYLAHLEPPT